MTLYFQVQFLKLKLTEYVKSTIKNALKSERKKKKSLKDITKNQKRMRGAKERYRDPESTVLKNEGQEYPEQEEENEKRKYKENLQPKIEGKS